MLLRVGRVLKGSENDYSLNMRNILWILIRSYHTTHLFCSLLFCEDCRLDGIDRLSCALACFSSPNKSHTHQI